jgi:hypothetical protein
MTMPSSAQHKEKAERNRACLLALSGTNSPEWQAIIAFYTALHLVERLSACDSIHNTKHQDRLDYLKKHKRHRVIYTNLASLFDASLVARYGTVNQFNTAYPDDTVEKILIAKHLGAIETYVASWFPSPPPAPPPPPSAASTP